MVVKGFFGNRDKLAGIVSFGGKDCNEIPALFTRVSAYRQWLEERICRGSPSEDAIPDWCPLTQNPVNTGASQRPEAKRPSSPIKADVGPRSRPPNASGKQTSPPRLYPTSQPVLVSTANCFSGSNTVDVRERGITFMKDLKIGDWVKTYHDRYEPIYSFGHWKPDARAVVLEFQTTQSTLRLTRDHIMFKKHHQPLPASDIRVGDILMDGFGDTSTTTSQVVAIRQHVQDLGLFAPFTPSGTLLVNGILVSSYVTIMPYQKTNSMTGVGGNERVHLQKLCQRHSAIMNPHWLSHAALFPRRIRCYYVGSDCQNESFTSDGINTWDNVHLQYSLRILKWNDLARNVFLFLVVVLALLFTVIETGIQFLGVFPFMFLLIIAMATVVIWFIRMKRL
jgi:Hint module